LLRTINFVVEADTSSTDIRLVVHTKSLSFRTRQIMNSGLISSLVLLAFTALMVFGKSVHAPDPVYGTNEYVEYIPGTGPLVISVPHGGYLAPSSIPDRTDGTTEGDARTMEISRELVNEIEFQGGASFRPHLIINRLDRSKLDANRDKDEAAEGNRQSELAWEEYHGFIEQACNEVTRRFGRGLYIDLHGQSHVQDWTEIGYLLTRVELALSDSTLNQPSYINRTSVQYRGRVLSAQGTPFSQFLRGPRSLGGLLEEEGLKAVPSPSYPDPSGGNYFNGGYSTDRHGSINGGVVDGIQIELSRGFRFTEPIQLVQNIRSLARIIIEYYDYFWK